MKAYIFSIILVLISLMPTYAQDTEVPADDLLESDVQDCQQFFLLEHEKGLPDFISYRSLNFVQEFTKISDTKVKFQTRVLGELPMPQDPFPLVNIPDGLGLYQKPSRYIQSNDEIIQKIAQDIIEEAKPENAKEAVFAVLRWSRNRLSWGDPSALPSAVEAYH